MASLQTKNSVQSDVAAPLLGEARTQDDGEHRVECLRNGKEEGLCTDRDGGDFTGKGVFVLQEVKEHTLRYERNAIVRRLLLVAESTRPGNGCNPRALDGCQDSPLPLPPAPPPAVQALTAI